MSDSEYAPGGRLDLIGNSKTRSNLLQGLQFVLNMVKESKSYLIIAQENANNDWYIPFQFRIEKIAKNFTPTRIVAKLTKEDANQLRLNPLIKLVECNEPISDKEVSQKILELYADEKTEELGDALLNLMAAIKSKS